MMGARPTHPELLDWLAAGFVEHDWSIKRLHRLIMTSATYRRGSRHPTTAPLRRADPDNELLATFPPRRLTAEEIRDSMLAVSGELDLTMGGPGIRPEINTEVALMPRHIMGSVAPAYQPSRTPAERNRRTIYAFRIRSLENPMLEVFNKPGPDLSCETRSATTITPQVFALMNGRSAHARALALANRVARTVRADVDVRIRAAFRLAYGRDPSESERTSARRHVAKMRDHHRRHEPVERRLPTSVEREMVEEMTGLSYHWNERLDIYEDYVGDLSPRDVSAETRALAELCLVLLNSNEFVYVY